MFGEHWDEARKAQLRRGCLPTAFGPHMLWDIHKHLFRIQNLWNNCGLCHCPHYILCWLLNFLFSLMNHKPHEIKVLLSSFTAETPVFNLTPCKLQTLNRQLLRTSDFYFLHQEIKWLPVCDDVGRKRREVKVKTFWFHESVNVLFLFIAFCHLVNYEWLLFSQPN